MTASAESAAAATSSDPDLRAILGRLRDATRRNVPTYDERIAALDKLRKALLARKDALARAVSADFGHRSKHETLGGDLLPVLTAITHAKNHLRDWMDPEEREANWFQWPSSAHVVRQPVGVVGIIAPWNYPIQLTLSPLVGAVAAGNRVMIKPSELAPQSAEALRDVVADAFAADWVQVVTGAQDVAEAFAALPFDHLFFTGSTRVGKKVMRAASENLVPVTLELGGKSPAIVGPDYDAAEAALRIVGGKTYNAGQTCVAPDYALVPAEKRAAFVDACRDAFASFYPTLATNPDYTSIVDDAHFARLRSMIDDAKAHDATLVELNPAKEDLDAAARKMAPVLVLEPTDAMLCMQEEIFGPVLPVVTYRSLDEAIAFVNARPRPLALYYFGHSRDAIQRVISETVSGGVTVNETLLHFVQSDLPCGGIGASGMGQYHGREGFDALTHKKPVFRQSRLGGRGLLRPPYRTMADRILRLLLGS